MKELVNANRRLKQMYADLSLENRVLKDVIEKTLRPTEKRELIDFAKQAHGLSVRCACKAFDISLTVYHYEPDATGMSRL